MTICLAIPHTPWVPERVESFRRLLDGLETDVYAGEHRKVFDDRESNRVWSQKLFRWALETGATHLLQLQDDAIVAPRFWPILRAMVEAQPNRLIGLEAAHPLGPAQHHVGRRWYRTRAWLIGVGYVFPRTLLEQFVAWCDANPDLVASTNEDSLISKWCVGAAVDVWHPVPTIIDHDLDVPSTYGNDTHHEWSLFRRPTVTWRDVTTNLAALEDPDYWRASLDAAPLLPGPGTALCWICGEGQGFLTHPKTGGRLCKQCLANAMSNVLSRV